MMHGNGNLDKTIDLLNQRDRDDFRNFVNSSFIQPAQYANL